MIDTADYLVMESTYGNRLHMRNDDKATMFLDIVYETLEKGGTVVIPSFAVGRTQEILFELNRIKEEKWDNFVATGLMNDFATHNVQCCKLHCWYHTYRQAPM